MTNQMSWSNLLSHQRYKDRPGTSRKLDEEEGRSQFQKDMDRIIFSRPFRRLAKKTQVHPMAKNDHMHTRLTHTVEVANVGKTLGTTLGLKIKAQRPDALPVEISPSHIGEIVQAACYAHDIGNPPFGHTGEEAITDYLKQDLVKRLDDFRQELTPESITTLSNLAAVKRHCDFEGNAQGFRAITKLQHHRNNGGLRLTYATLGTFLKYPWSSNLAEQHAGKFNAFPSEQDILSEVAGVLGLLPGEGSSFCRHPLAYLVEAADDMCYRTMDLEDAVEAKIITFKEFCEIFEPLLDKHHPMHKEVIEGDRYTEKEKIGYIRAKSIGKAVDAVVDTFMQHYDDILSGKGIKTVNGEFVQKDLIFHCQATYEHVAVAARKAAAKAKRVYKDRRKVELETGSFFVVRTILNACLDALFEWHKCPTDTEKEKLSSRSQHVLSIMGDESPENNHEFEDDFRRCIDFVAGMTDEYATYLSNQLCGAAQ